MEDDMAAPAPARAGTAVKMELPSPPTHTSSNANNKKEEELRKAAPEVPATPSTQSGNITMLMSSNQWKDEGPRAQNQVLDHLRRHSVNVRPDEDLPAGSYLWLTTRSNDAGNIASDDDTSLDYHHVLDVIVERIHYNRDTDKLLSVTSDEQWKPLTEFSLNLTKLSFSKVNRRILLIEGEESEAEDQGNSSNHTTTGRLKAHLETLKQLDPTALEVQRTRTPKESIRFLKSIHHNLLLQQQNELLQTSSHTYKQFKERSHAKLHSGKFILLLALRRHGMDQRRIHDLWEAIAVELNTVRRALFSTNTSLQEKALAIVTPLVPTMELEEAVIIAKELVRAHDNGWWILAAEEQSSSMDLHQDPNKQISLSKQARVSAVSPEASRDNRNSPPSMMSKSSGQQTYSGPFSKTQDMALWYGHKMVAFQLTSAMANRWNILSESYFYGRRTPEALERRWKSLDFRKHILQEISADQEQPYDVQDDLLLWHGRTQMLQSWSEISESYFVSTRSTKSLAERWRSEAFDMTIWQHYDHHVVEQQRSSPWSSISDYYKFKQDIDATVPPDQTSTRLRPQASGQDHQRNPRKRKRKWYPQQPPPPPHSVQHGHLHPDQAVYWQSHSAGPYSYAPLHPPPTGMYPHHFHPPPPPASTMVPIMPPPPPRSPHPSPPFQTQKDNTASEYPLPEPWVHDV